MNRKQKKILIRIISSVVLSVLTVVLPIDENLKNFVFLVPYLVIGCDILISAGRGVINRQPFDENFLMAVATVGAILLGEFVEAVAVMLFYQIGELFQSYAVGKSRKSISALMDIRPDYANVLEDNEIKTVDPCEVLVGSIIVVKPGEKIPLDGIIEEGIGDVDTASLTGESLPREVNIGDEVQSGAISLNSVLKIRTIKEFSESTVSKILDLVENASSRKSKSENFISKFAKFYTPIVCYSALALAIVPTVFGIPGNWIYRALTFLVISCPCALVISVPLSFFAGIGGASREGILIKGSNYLETLSKVKSVVFDKTGTMTEGKFSVTQIEAVKLQKDKILEYAAYAESYSVHPISKCITEAYGEAIDKSRIEDVKEISGFGVSAKIDGLEVSVGNAKLMASLNLKPFDISEVGTAVHIAIDGAYTGYILISDRIKRDAPATILSLKKLGVKKTVMLTGDAEPVANSVAAELCIDEVYSELLPNEKVKIVEEKLVEQGSGDKLAFVGDGINDAPSLVRADIGIAMGALGSDAAIEAADVVLMDDNPIKVTKAILIAKKCLAIVYQNIYFAIGIKLLCLVLGAIGIANMWLAIFADVGVMVIAVINAIRALKGGKMKWHIVSTRNYSKL